MTDNAELPPCPFCGGEAEVVQPVGKRWAAYCIGWNCPTDPMTESHATKDEAIAAWNTRIANTLERKPLPEAPNVKEVERRLAGERDERKFVK